MRFKAVRFIVWRQDRYFVIPEDREIEDLIIGERTMSLDVVAQCPTFESAGNVAYAMNKVFGVEKVKP